LSKGGIIVVIPDITLYELRRELFWIKASVKLVRLELWRGATESAEVTPEASKPPNSGRLLDPSASRRPTLRLLTVMPSWPVSRRRLATLATS
jgi:hypothetical protein